MSYQIAAIPRPLIDVVWSQVEPILQRVVDYVPNELSCEDIRTKLLIDDNLLLTISKGPNIVACAILEGIEISDRLNALFVKALSGDDFDEWSEQLDTVLQALAKDFNCNQVRMAGIRKGWIKKLAPLGWAETYVIMTKEVA